MKGFNCKLFWFTFTILQINCHLGVAKNDKETLTPVISPKQEDHSALARMNLGDQLSEDKIARISNNFRYVLSNSPYAMRDIFFSAGCSNGASVREIIFTKLIDINNDLWTAQCFDQTKDEIFFFIPSLGNKTIYSFYNSTVQPMIQNAEKYFTSGDFFRSGELYKKILEYEPAMPIPRLRLGLIELNKGNCSKAVRHLRIYRNLAPYYEEKIQKQYKEKCGSTLPSG